MKLRPKNFFYKKIIICPQQFSMIHQNLTGPIMNTLLPQLTTVHDVRTAANAD